MSESNNEHNHGHSHTNMDYPEDRPEINAHKVLHILHNFENYKHKNKIDHEKIKLFLNKGLDKNKRNLDKAKARNVDRYLKKWTVDDSSLPKHNLNQDDKFEIQEHYDHEGPFYRVIVIGKNRKIQGAKFRYVNTIEGDSLEASRVKLHNNLNHYIVVEVSEDGKGIQIKTGDSGSDDFHYGDVHGSGGD